MTVLTLGGLNYGAVDRLDTELEKKEGVIR